MSSIEERARAAQRLLDDPDLTAVLSEIEAAATAAFLASGGDPERMADAHKRVEAITTLRQALQSRLTDRDMALKKERQRD